jgi:hypothetical protein
LDGIKCIKNNFIIKIQRDAEPDAHLWTECDSSNDSCYLKSQPDCKIRSSSARERCNACRIAVHRDCKSRILKTKCKVTFDDGNQTKVSLSTHKWVNVPRSSGRCSFKDCNEKFDKSKLPKMLSTEKKPSDEEAPVMCTWCKKSYHYKCVHRLSPEENICDFGEHRKLIVPPSWICKKRYKYI